MAVCSHCGTSLNEAALGVLCPRCLALDCFGPELAGDDSIAAARSDRTEVRLGNYDLLEEISRGGMGIVYRARQINLEREVAVKVLLHGIMAGDAALARFQAEAKAAASLQHPNIVAIHEVGEHEGQSFFSMEYVPGGTTLADLVREGPLDPSRAARYLSRVAAALQYAHEREVLHRDLKPSNVLIDRQDQPRVTDFGLAKRLNDESELTSSGQVLGTPAYIAPEQADRKRGPVTVRSDIYSLGALLYHLLTGRPPFVGDSPAAILARMLEGEPIAPRLLNPALPRDLETVCLKCLEKEPGRRYGSALALADELERFLSHQPIHARPISRTERLWRWGRRQPALATTLGACAVILASGSGGVLWQLRQTRAAKTMATEKARQEMAQRKLAEQAQQQARRSELLMRQNLYAADMLGVQRALEQNDFGAARQLLDTHRPDRGSVDLRGFEWRYFWSQARGDSVRTLNPHTGSAVTAIAFSPNGEQLAFSSREVFLCPTSAWERCGHGHFWWPTSLSFTPDGDTLLVGDRSRVCRWDWKNKSGAPADCFAVHREWPLASVSADGNWLAVGDHSNLMLDRERDGLTDLYRLKDGNEPIHLPESGSVPAFSADGTVLATGSWLGQVKLWRMPSAELLRILTNAPRVVSLAFSPDGRTLAVGTFYEGLWLYDVSTGKRRPGARGHTARITQAAFSPDGTTLATASADQTVRLWDFHSGVETAQLRGHSFAVNHLAWSPDGRRLASGGEDGTVRIWEPRRHQPPEKRLSGWLMPRPFSKDGRLLAVANSHDHVTVYEYPSLNVAGRSHRPFGVPLGFSSDGTQLLSIRQTSPGGPCEVVRSRVDEAGTIQRTPLPDSAESLLIARLSFDARWLAAGRRRGEVILWDLEHGAPLTKLSTPQGGCVRVLTFSPDNRLLAAHFEEPATAYLWDLKSQADPMELRGPGAWSQSVFTPDGSLLIIGDSLRQIALWDVKARKELGTLSGHAAGISTLDVSPDGKTLASSSDDRTVRLWNLASRREIARFATAHNSTRVCFAPDGEALLIYDTIDGQLTVEARWRAPGFAVTDAPPAEGSW
ncbi:MAG: serine/threonine-protein kinase [Verrucomicrobiota bacterium]